MPAALRVAAALCLAAVAATGCSFPEERPSFEILTPEDGSINDSSSLLVQIAVKDFTLDPETFGDGPGDQPGDDSKPYHGHWHLYIVPSDTAGNLIFEQALGYDILGGSDTALLTDVVLPASHLNADPPIPYQPQIIAELVNQNHSHIQGVDFEIADVTIPPDAPSIVLVEPDDGENASSSIGIDVEISNFTLDSSLGGANVTDHGHYHVYVGSQTVPVEAVTPQITLTDIVPVSGNGGFVDILVELVANDHSTLSTPVVDGTFVEVDADEPRVAILAPLANAVVGTAFSLELAFGGDFELTDFTTTVQNSAGQGHFHVYVDDADVGHDFSLNSGPYPITPGPHEIRVQLTGNDHDALFPYVIDLVDVTSTP